MGDDAALLRFTPEDNLVSKYNCAMDLAMKNLYLQQFCKRDYAIKGVGSILVPIKNARSVLSHTFYTFYG